jgi:hypothetical protein
VVRGGGRRPLVLRRPSGDRCRLPSSSSRAARGRGHRTGETGREAACGGRTAGVPGLSDGDGGGRALQIAMQLVDLGHGTGTGAHHTAAAAPASTPPRSTYMRAGVIHGPRGARALAPAKAPRHLTSPAAPGPETRAPRLSLRWKWDRDEVVA